MGAVAIFIASPQERLEGQVGRGSTVEGLFGEPTFVFLHPSVTLLRGGTERRLSGEIGWEMGGGTWDHGIGFMFGTSDHPGSYTWSGARMGFGRTGPAMRMETRFEVHGASGEGPDGSGLLELGARVGSHTLRVGSTWLRGIPGDEEGGLGAPGQGASWDHYVDAELTVARDLGRARLALSGGGRIAAVTPGPARWAQSTVRLPIGRGLGLAAGAGIRPDRPQEGRLGGRFFEIGGTLRLGGPRPDPEAAPRPLALRAETLGAGTYLITVEAWNASEVELRGDLTDWKTVALGRSDSVDHLWTMHVVRPPGVYQVTLQIDGGDWLVPHGLVPLPGRFGGTTGLLELPSDGADKDAR